MNTPAPIITREYAKHHNYTAYDSDIPCPRHGLVERYTVSYKCKLCVAAARPPKKIRVKVQRRSEADIMSSIQAKMKLRQI